LIVFNTEELTGSQESGKKKKKKRKQPDQLIVSTLYFPLKMPVKPINWFDDLPCLGMENQSTNGSQESGKKPRMPIKPIILSQSINMIKVDHQSHDDDKEEYNAVADKRLFKSTNWFLNLGINGHFCHNTDYFIQYERIDKNALTVYDENKLLIIRKKIIKITIINPRNRHITFYVTNVNHSPAVRLNILFHTL
jgi:hypothetical protein